MKPQLRSQEGAPQRRNLNECCECCVLIKMLRSSGAFQNRSEPKKILRGIFRLAPFPTAPYITAMCSVSFIGARRSHSKMRLPTSIILLASITVLVDAAALSTVTLDCGLDCSFPNTIYYLLRSTTDGSFTGLTDTENAIIYFRGVRYADPPVGALRWKAPVSPPTSQLGKVNASAVSNFAYL